MAELCVFHQKLETYFLTFRSWARVRESPNWSQPNNNQQELKTENYNQKVRGKQVGFPNLCVIIVQVPLTRLRGVYVALLK